MTEEEDKAIGKLQQRMSSLLESVGLLEAFLNKYKPEEHEGQVQVRLAKLEEFFTEFFDLAAELELYSTKKTPISTKDERFLFENKYYALKVALQSKIPVPPSKTLSTVVKPAATSSHIRYPEVPLLKFSGRQEDWVSFRDSFNAGVVNRREIEDVDKLQYLKGLVQGDAARLIGHIEISEEGYRTAWKLLTRRYENKRRLIFCHLQALYETPAMRKETGEELLRVIDSFEEHLSNLKRLGEPTDRWSSCLVYHLYIRLDPNTKREWDRHCNSVDTKEYGSSTLDDDKGDDMPTYVDMLRFLQGYAKVLQSSKAALPSRSDRPYKSNSVRVASHVASNSGRSSSQSSCYQCGQQHYIYQCPEFRKISVNQRYELVDRNGLCSNCLRTTKHTARTCPSGTCNNCNKKHNSLLHDPRYDQQRHQSNQQRTAGKQQSNNQPSGPANQGQQSLSQGSASEPSTSQQSGQSSVSCSASRSDNRERVVLLPTAFVNLEDAKGKKVIARGVLDSGSQCHFISNHLCQMLSLPRKRIPFPIQVSGIGQASAKVTHFVFADISSLHSDFKVKLRMLVLPDVTANLPINDIDTSEWEIPEHVCLADPTFAKTNSVDFIVGAEYFFKILQYGKIELGNDLPLLQNTLLGWVVSGGCGQKLSQQMVCNIQHSSPLEEMVRRFWQLETCHDLRGWSPEERACEQFFLDTTVRNSEGRYVVKLPRRKELIGQLKDNRYNAERQFYSLERKLEANPELKALYHDFIREYEALGHMREVKDDEPEVELQYFLPHHAVLRPESSTTKLRTVFNASCKSKSGLSLNDVLLTGPTVQDTLIAIIFRFRMYAFVVVADITKMYRQILVDIVDQTLLRILFRFSKDEPIKIYQLLTVTYGTNCAPYLATRVLQKLADDEADRYPLAAPVVRKSFYVDDMLTGSDNVQELKQVIEQVNGMMESAGFSLRKWASNNQEVLANLPVELHEKTTTLNLDNESSVTTLGLHWDTLRDELRFKQPKWTQSENITKRLVLSQLASLFDPLGLIGPAIVKAKIFMQTLWKHQIDWDVTLPAAFQQEWHEFQLQISNIEQISIPRYILPLRKAEKHELHGFSDASESAYGACLYIRSITSDGFCTTRLLSSKSRVAPIDNKSIPRLELCGALLLSHLLQKFLESVEIKASIYLWTDSTVVLCWLSGTPSSWKTFVANRVAEIQELTPHAAWNHVPSEDNPADIISRGLDLTTLSKSSFWWNGPNWLGSVDDNWPQKYTAPDSVNGPEYEAKKVVALPTTTSMEDNEDLVSRFSTLKQLIAIAAWGLRFSFNCRSSPDQRRSGTLTIEEKEEAFMKLVGRVQEDAFQQELAALRQNKPVPKSSKLRFLKPRIINGLIRVGGRLHNAEIAINAKHPLVLPGKHYLTNLIAWSEHFKTLHGGPQLLLSTIRQRFWPLGGRDMVRRLVHSCVTCTRANPQSMQQLMGNLPHDRITSSFVFENVGIDFAGPMYLRSGVRFTRPVKGYIAIFVCLTTKAAHLELVMSLTTPAFLAALKRFISRRGKPANIYCDNAKNFRGASTQLEDLRKLFISENHKNDIRSFCEPDNIQFHFIPPRAPSFGGLWEACVKSTKYHLRRIVGTARLNKEEFETVLAEVEACLNSRPITPLSTDPSDLQALTPGHFIIGRPLNAMPEPDLTAAPTNQLTRWQRMQQIAQHFWKRWHREYLTSLQQTYRWSMATQNLAVGSIVIVKEDNQPPLSWPLAIVTAVHPGADGLVRVATIRTATASYKRAITRLCLLPVEVNVSTNPPPNRAAGSSAGDERADSSTSNQSMTATRRAQLEAAARSNQPKVRLVDIRQQQQQQ